MSLMVRPPGPMATPILSRGSCSWRMRGAYGDSWPRGSGAHLRGGGRKGGGMHVLSVPTKRGLAAQAAGKGPKCTTITAAGPATDRGNQNALQHATPISLAHLPQDVAPARRRRLQRLLHDFQRDAFHLQFGDRRRDRMGWAGRRAGRQEQAGTPPFSGRLTVGGSRGPAETGGCGGRLASSAGTMCVQTSCPAGVDWEAVCRADRQAAHARARRSP